MPFITKVVQILERNSAVLGLNNSTIKKIISDFDLEINDIDNRLDNLKKKLNKGIYTRAQMPVIPSYDITLFSKWLSEKGISNNLTKTEIDKLKPLQHQVYLEKVLGHIKNQGYKGSLEYATKQPFVVSKKNFIIDGHHRFLTAMLLNPKSMVTVLRCQVDKDTLLKLAQEYTDLMGRQRNI